MRKRERVLLVEAVSALGQRAARRIVAAGDDALVVGSVAEARSARGNFDRGVFGFDLPDGSGIVLAAELFLEARIHNIGFFHPDEERAVLEECPSGVHATLGTPEAAPARHVA